MEDERNEKYAGILGEMIRCRTVSVAGGENEDGFPEFRHLVKRLFPNLFKVTGEPETILGAFFMKWPGKKSDAPIMLMSHHDVVSVGGEWKHPAFSGEIAGGKIWGRGTLDTKGSLFAILMAADELAAEGFVPENDIWFESDSREETDGEGARLVVEELAKRGIRFKFVIDEGGMILFEPVGGAKGTFAMVGVGEKGTCDLKFTAVSSGGHGSTPGKNTPLVRLGKFMADVEKSDCFEVEIAPVIEEMFVRLSASMSGAMKFLFKNAKFFKPLLKIALPKISATTNALVRTTLAFTMAKGSDGRNVIPTEAYVTGNMRFSHHQGRDSSVAEIKKIADRYDVRVEIIEPGIESKISDYNAEGFKTVEKAIAEVFPGVTAAPYLMTGASDCRFFDKVSDCCLRFAPYTISEEQLHSIHGENECVDFETLAPAVDFFRCIIKGQ